MRIERCYFYSCFAAILFAIVIAHLCETNRKVKFTEAELGRSDTRVRNGAEPLANNSNRQLSAHASSFARYNGVAV